MTIPNEEYLASSIKGRNLEVEYFLIFFVKHDAWNQWGDGCRISHKINLVQNEGVVTPNMMPMMQQPMMQQPMMQQPMMQQPMMQQPMMQ